MLVMKDNSSGEIESIDEYEEEAMSSGWNPAIADLIHREVDHHEIMPAENPMPSDLADVDVNDFIEKMYTTSISYSDWPCGARPIRNGWHCG